MTHDDDEDDEASLNLLKRHARILRRDDPDGFVELYHEPPLHKSDWILSCAIDKAKKCLVTLLTKDIFDPPVEVDGYAIYNVAWYFLDPDVINLLLMRDPSIDLNIKHHMACNFGTPLEITLNALSSYMHLENLHSWSQGDSVFKLIFLLCQWKLKTRLDGARLLASRTH